MKLLTATRVLLRILPLTCLDIEPYLVPPKQTHEALPEWELHDGPSVAKETTYGAINGLETIWGSHIWSRGPPIARKRKIVIDGPGD